MFRMYAVFFCFGLLFLTGCSFTPKEPREVVVTKTKHVLVLPPDNLLQDCTITPPPPKKTYIYKNYKEKEEILVDFGAKQTKNLGDCNADKASLRSWRDKAKSSYRE